MSEQPNIIIVGASARAAAFSALRAGMRPYAIDLFADCDLADVCPAVKIERYPHDFEQALAAAPQAPWIYTGGLENYPDLVDRLTRLRTLSGNGGEVLRRIRASELLTECLLGTEFSMPEIRMAPPPVDSEGEWLRKPRRSSGGLGIRKFRFAEVHGGEAEFYYQRYVPGASSSAVYLAATEGCELLGVTQQQSGVAEIPEEPFLYAGSSMDGDSVRFDVQFLQSLQALGVRLARQFGLRGLFNADFVNQFCLVEVNPRYSASVEVLEHGLGRNLLARHLMAFDPNLRLIPGCEVASLSRTVAKRVVYATRDCFVTADLKGLRDSWNTHQLLPCLADIPRTGDRILRGQPVATVIAEGWSHDEVQRLLSERVAAVRRTLVPEEARNLSQRHEGTEENGL